MSAGTLYIAPSTGVQCRIYFMPYPMRPKQRPSDIAERYQRDWREVGLMRADYRAGHLKVVCLDREFQSLSEGLEGIGAGGFITLERQSDGGWCERRGVSDQAV